LHIGFLYNFTQPLPEKAWGKRGKTETEIHGYRSWSIDCQLVNLVEGITVVKI